MTGIGEARSLLFVPGTRAGASGPSAGARAMPSDVVLATLSITATSTVSSANTGW